MLRTLIIDDEPAIRRDLQLLLSSYPDFICIGSCGSIADARVLIENTQPDLVLLDIQLSDGTSFELLQSLPSIPFRIIFITAYGDQAIRAIKMGALDFLVKPIDEEELGTALNKALHANAAHHTEQQVRIANEHLQSQPTFLSRNRIALRTQSYLQVVQYEDIIYCQSDASYTTFYLTDKRKIVTSKPIGEYEELLPSSHFARTHQSYLVNLDFVDRLHKDNYLVLKNGMEIPVSTRKKDTIVKKLTGHA
ncbi:LytR/AlgR family response regulator transcription factor [Chitinophagaceae bacterium MMS25-I14]